MFHKSTRSVIPSYTKTMYSYEVATLTRLPTAYPDVISTKKKMVSITNKVMILASRSNFIVKGLIYVGRRIPRWIDGRPVIRSGWTFGYEYSLARDLIMSLYSLSIDR